MPDAAIFCRFFRLLPPRRHILRQPAPFSAFPKYAFITLTPITTLITPHYSLRLPPAYASSSSSSRLSAASFQLRARRQLSFSLRRHTGFTCRRLLSCLRATIFIAYGFKIAPSSIFRPGCGIIAFRSDALPPRHFSAFLR